MKIELTNPPHNIRELCEERFDISRVTPVWTYGDTLYNPHQAVMDKPLYAHELAHVHQQGEEPAKWWTRYLEDEKFRFSQEVEAYQKQYQTICKEYRDKNIRYRALYALSLDLGGAMYGGLCSPTEARRLIAVIDK